MHDRGAQTEVVAHLGDHVGGGVPRETDGGELGVVDVVLGGQDRGLVVRTALVVEEGLRHPWDAPPVERVVVVREREDQVADSHADCVALVRCRGGNGSPRDSRYELSSMEAEGARLDKMVIVS